MICPYRISRGMFDDAFADRLLAYALAHEASFEVSRISNADDGDVDPTFRVSRSLGKFGALKQELRRRILDAAPGLMKQLGVTPFEVVKVEAEMVAHGDGAFYSNHTDVDFSDRSAPTVRLLSAVYYFHRRPKAYSGGALRLHAIGSSGTGEHVDIEPEHNALVFFPSWALHEVRPVSCPSRAFADSRFAINCWLLRKKAAP